MSTYLEVQRQNVALAGSLREDHERKISYYRDLVRVLRERPDLADEGWSAERVAALLAAEEVPPRGLASPVSLYGD